MFKTSNDVIQFVDKLEEFIRAAVTNMASLHVEDAVYLNKKRGEFQDCISQLAGVIEKQVDESKTYACPDCGSEMVARTNRQNGEKFWGCKKYPDCRGTRDSAGLSKQEKYELQYKKEVVNQQDGFSFNKKRHAATEVSPETTE